MRFPRATIWNVVTFAALAFAANVGFVFGLFPTNALLITHVGTDALFAAYLWSALAVLGFSGLFAWIADRYPRRRLFLGSHWLAAASVLVAWWAVRQPQVEFWWYALIRAFFYGYYILLSLQFWVLASDHFSSYEAKRVYPYVIAASIGGMMVGGLITSFVAGTLPAADFLLLWAGILGLSPGLLWCLRLRPVLYGRVHQASATTPLVGTWSLSLLMLLFWMIYAFLCHGVDYVYNVVASAALPDPDQLTAFFGKVTCVASLVVLIYQLGLAKRIATRFGIDRALLMIPLLAVGACGLLVAQPSLFGVAVAEATVFFFVDFAGSALVQPLLNIVPRSQRGRVKMGTEGVGRSVGVVGLFFLATVGTAVIVPERLSGLLFAVSLAFLGFPILFHRIYLRHLVRCLRSPDQELVLNAIQALGEPNKVAATRPLLRLLRATTQLHLQRTIVLSLGQMRSGEAFQEVVQLFDVRNEALQNAVVEALGDYRNYESILAIFRLMKSGNNVSLQVRMNAVMLLTRLLGRAMTPFLLQALDDSDPRVQANTLEALGLLRDRATIRLLQPFLTHPHHRVRGSAIIALYPFRFRPRSVRPLVLQALAQLYTSPQALEHRTALHVIGALRCRAYIPDLLRQLATPDRHTRQHVAIALAKLQVHQCTPVLVELMLDADETFAIDTAKRMGQFPAVSRWRVFEAIDQLPTTPRAVVFTRLEATGLDFSAEQEQLGSRATLFTYAPW
ncbi:MAG: HEAT repeat domain-containing protein [Deltaproteobacteria bacterium]|nr:HEAT repeat domain-containing protein [Deltaproteobacteria bacterium]